MHHSSPTPSVHWSWLNHCAMVVFTPLSSKKTDLFFRFYTLYFLHHKPHHLISFRGDSHPSPSDLQFVPAASPASFHTISPHQISSVYSTAQGRPSSAAAAAARISPPSPPHSTPPPSTTRRFWLLNPLPWKILRVVTVTVHIVR